MIIPNSEWEVINNKEEWEEYRLRTDKSHRYSHWDKNDNSLLFRHWHDPEEYPCLVISEWEDNPDSQDYIIHRFIYEKESRALLTAVFYKRIKG